MLFSLRNMNLNDMKDVNIEIVLEKLKTKKEKLNILENQTFEKNLDLQKYNLEIEEIENELLRINSLEGFDTKVEEMKSKLKKISLENEIKAKKEKIVILEKNHKEEMEKISNEIKENIKSLKNEIKDIILNTKETIEKYILYPIVSDKDMEIILNLKNINASMYSSDLQEVLEKIRKDLDYCETNKELEGIINYKDLDDIKEFYKNIFFQNIKELNNIILKEEKLMEKIEEIESKIRRVEQEIETANYQFNAAVNMSITDFWGNISDDKMDEQAESMQYWQNETSKGWKTHESLTKEKKNLLNQSVLDEVKKAYNQYITSKDMVQETINVIWEEILNKNSLDINY